jgi:hypothetical protein
MNTPTSCEIRFAAHQRPTPIDPFEGATPRLDPITLFTIEGA